VIASRYRGEPEDQKRGERRDHRDDVLEQDDPGGGLGFEQIRGFGDVFAFLVADGRSVASVGVDWPPPTVGASSASALSAPGEAPGTSPRTVWESVVVRVARPQPRPTMLIVAMMTKLAGMPSAERKVTMVELTMATK